MNTEEKKTNSDNRISLTRNIFTLISSLEKQNKKNNINQMLLVICTALLVFVTGWLVYSNTSHSDSIMKAERLSQTVTLCKEFNEFYSNYSAIESNMELRQMRDWVRNESNWIDTAFLSLDPIGKLEVLYKNLIVKKLFNYFETAKMLHKKELLDEEYFSNWFETLFIGMQRTDNPTVDSFIEYYRDMKKNDKIWDGYYYCRDSIIWKK